MVTTPAGVVARVVASGPICVLPSTIAPAPTSRATAVASNGGTKPSNTKGLTLVSMPAV